MRPVSPVQHGLMGAGAGQEQAVRAREPRPGRLTWSCGQWGPCKVTHWGETGQMMSNLHPFCRVTLSKCFLLSIK